MKAGTAGGIEAVVKVINTHVNNVDVCEKGCGALKNMTWDNGKRLIKHNNQNKMSS